MDSINQAVILSSLTRRGELRPEMNRSVASQMPVPHPFAFLLAKGWKTSSHNPPRSSGAEFGAFCAPNGVEGPAFRLPKDAKNIRLGALARIGSFPVESGVPGAAP